MFKIEVDTTALVKRITDARNRIVHFKRVDLGAELSAWQVEELHRHRPFTMRWRAQGRAQTKIRPHSLYEMMKSEGFALGPKEMRRARRALSKHLQHPLPRARKLKLREHRHWSTRPILRQEMERRLIQRMRECAEEKIHW